MRQTMPPVPVDDVGHSEQNVQPLNHEALPGDLFNVTDSEDEDEEDQIGDPYAGYQALPSEPPPATHAPHSDDEWPLPPDVQAISTDGVSQDNASTVPAISYAPVSFNITTSASSDAETPMTKEDIERIRTYMSGFALPEAHHPAWARAVVEDDWKAHLLAQIARRNAS